jgi:hypothetical protein
MRTARFTVKSESVPEVVSRLFVEVSLPFPLFCLSSCCRFPPLFPSRVTDDCHPLRSQTNFFTLIAVLLSLAFYLAWDAQGHASGVSTAFSILAPKLALLSMLASVNSGAETIRTGLDSRAVKHVSVRPPFSQLLSLASSSFHRNDADADQ